MSQMTAVQSEWSGRRVRDREAFGAGTGASYRPHQDTGLRRLS